jgi:hypothetical protein
MKVMIGSAVWRTLEARHVAALVPVLRQPGFMYVPQTGDALVERARSMSATWFLNHTDADVHLSIDSDITDFTVDAVKKVCEQAMTHDIVCGLYVTRSGNARPYPTTFIGADEDVEMGTDLDQLHPVDWGATGFMAVHRRVFEKLATGLPLLHKSNGQRAFYPFYQTMIAEHNGEKILLSEDYAFCQRARDACFGVWWNPGVRLGHIGQYPYRMEDMAAEFLEPQPLVVRRTGPGAHWTIRSPGELAAEAVAQGGLTHATDHTPQPATRT